MSLYRFAVGLLGPVLRLVWQPEVRGKEKIPTDRGGILVCNHLKWWDPLLLAVVLPKNTLHFMSKVELFQNRFVGWLLRQLNCIPVDRKRADLPAVKASIRTVNDGGILGVFPEGTRSRTGELLHFEEGTAFFALKCSCPIYPAHIDVQRSRGKRMVTFGDPIDASQIGPELQRSERMTLITEKMREEILVLAAEQKADRSAREKRR